MKKLAIIGCGGIGSYHLEHFLSYTDVELAGFCDIIPERAARFVEIAGRGRAFADFRAMYDAVRPDMVFVCVPPYAHGEIELETIRRGIPMFVEKPVALDIALARRIADEIAKARLITAVGFQCRYANIVAPTRDFVRAHQVAFVECARMGGIPDTPWWPFKDKSGGQLVEQTIHNLDMIRYMLGEAQTVFSLAARGFVTGQEPYDTDDLSVTAIRFQSGALGTLSTGCYATGGECCDNKITFSAADCRLDHYIIEKVVLHESGAAKAREGGIVVKGDGAMGPAGADGLTIADDGQAGIRCDRTFVEAAMTGDGSKILSPYADAVKTLEFALMCNRSMATGQPVSAL